MSVHRLLVNYDSSPEIKNVEVSNIDMANPFVKKIYFYNPLINEPLHKFWFCIKNAKILNVHANRIEIVIASSEEKLVTALKSLDAIVAESLKKLNIERALPSIITSANYPPRMELNLTSNSVIYDRNSKNGDITLLKKNLKFTAFIEFYSISIANSKVSRTWRVVQLKEEAPMDLTMSLFDTNNHSAYMPMHPVVGSYPHIPIPYYSSMPHMATSIPFPPFPPVPPPFPPPTHHRAEKPVANNEKQEKSCFVPPSADQLKDVLGRLKKRNDNTKQTKTPESESITENNNSNKILDTRMTKTTNIINDTKLTATKQINEIVNEPPIMFDKSKDSINTEYSVTIDDLIQFRKEIRGRQKQYSSKLSIIMKQIEITSAKIDAYLIKDKKQIMTNNNHKTKLITVIKSDTTKKEIRHSMHNQIQSDNIKVKSKTCVNDMLGESDDDYLDLSIIKK